MEHPKFPPRPTIHSLVFLLLKIKNQELVFLVFLLQMNKTALVKIFA